MTDSLMDRARALGLHGLIAHWDEVGECDWLTSLIAWEEEERRSRSLKRRLADARIGEFKPLADFNWDWPRRCDRMAVEDLMSLNFLNEAVNVVLVGPNGVGKSTIAANIAHRAVLAGHTVRFATAASLLGELATIDSDSLLQRKLRFYARSPSGPRPSQTPLASSPWSTASSTTPRSSPSTAIPIVERRPSSNRRNARPSGGGGAVHGLPPENRRGRRKPADQPIETARQYRG